MPLDLSSIGWSAISSMAFADLVRSKVMWRTPFPVVLWLCFEGKETPLEERIDKLKFSIASRVSILPHFLGIPIDFIMHGWKEVAFPSSMTLIFWISSGFEDCGPSVCGFCSFLFFFYCFLGWLSVYLSCIAKHFSMK